MKFSPLLLAATLFGHVNAATTTFDAEKGVYAADSSVSMAPPRSTHALIEADGSLWAADFSYTLQANSNFVIAGDIDPILGEGIALDYVMDPALALNIKSTVTSSAAKFRILSYVEGASQPLQNYHAPVTTYKPAAFDFDLVKLPVANLELTTGVYTTNNPYFSITFNKDVFTGYNGGCAFTGTVIPSMETHYKRVTLTYTNACYLTSNKQVQVPVLRNSKLEGVVFATRSFASGSTPNQSDAFVMIARPKSGQYNLGFSKMFRKPVAAPAPVVIAPVVVPVACVKPDAWINGKQYAAGALVTYSNLTYVAKFANPGYIPTVSTYFWSVTAGC